MTLSALIVAAALAISAAQPGVLGQEGVTLIGATGPIAFGVSEADALAYGGAVFGGEPARRQETACRNGAFSYADWGKGMTFVFQDGKLVGWAADRSLQGDYATQAGLNFRESVGALRQGRGGFMLADAVQGREFAYAGVWGRVLQRGSDATIDQMWAGLSCKRR